MRVAHIHRILAGHIHRHGLTCYDFEETRPHNSAVYGVRVPEILAQLRYDLWT